MNEAGKSWGLAVKAVIFDHQRRCLLLRRSSANRNFVGKWEFPGGKVDSGEDFETALLREVREEASLTVAIRGAAGATHFEMPAINVAVLFLEAEHVGGQVKLSEEHDDYAWVPLSDIASRPLPSQVQDFMQDYAKRKGAEQ